MDPSALAAAASGADQSKSGVAKKSLSDNFDQFLTMLTVQLQNQDPLSPMDSSEFTNQLVMFSQLEQEIAQNSNLEQLMAMQQSAESTAALGYLGHEIEAESSAVWLNKGETKFTYSMPAGADNATITILDLDGKTVASIPAETEAGYHEYVWDGRDGQDVLQPDGVYSVLVTAVDAKDKPMDPITVYMKGPAEGVVHEDGTTYLQVGPVDVPLSAVVAAYPYTPDPES